MKMIRIISIFFLLFLLLGACKKRKEIKEWKKREGIYLSATPYVIYQDSTKTIDINEMQVIASGLSGSGNSNISVNFSVFHKDENPNQDYEYKIQYSSLTNYTFGSGGVTNEQMPFEQFTQGREFYITFSGSEMKLTVVDDGVAENIVFQKQ
jgi:hypothetical protein